MADLLSTLISGLRRGATASGLALAAVLLASSPPAADDAAGPVVPDVPLQRLDGSPEALADYRGRVLLVVNTASRCGYTPQYSGLQEIHDRYQEKGFTVLGFPSNDFAGQEPGSAQEIKKFCTSRFGVTFPMFAKTRVKGDEAHPLYRFLTSQPQPIGGPVRWNFQKYLIDRRGRVVARIAPGTEPDSPELVRRIEDLLDESA